MYLGLDLGLHVFIPITFLGQKKKAQTNNTLLTGVCLKLRADLLSLVSQ